MTHQNLKNYLQTYKAPVHVLKVQIPGSILVMNSTRRFSITELSLGRLTIGRVSSVPLVNIHIQLSFLLTARVSLEVGFSAAAFERPTLNPLEGVVVSLP